jgi:hypothetical protein
MSYRDEVARQLARAAASEDPEAYRRRWLEHLLGQARVAEEAAGSAERAAAVAIEAMERRESARRAARRARNEHAALVASERAEAERLRRNARERARYRERREVGLWRADSRNGVHAIAIVVDPSAYQALKLEARRRSMSMPELLGEIIVADLGGAPASSMNESPRWRRTGEGRRANKHTRIDIEHDAWEQLHVDAIGRSVTVGRRIGLAIESWYARASTTELNRE